MDEQVFVSPASNNPPPPPVTPVAPQPINPASSVPPPPPVIPVAPSQTPPPPTPPLNPITPQSSLPNTPPILPPKKSSPIKLILIVLLSLLVVGGIGFGIYRYIQSKKVAADKTLVYWGLWEPESAIRPIFEEYERAHPGIKIDYRANNFTQYRERLSSALSQQKGPDIFRIHNAWVPMFKGNLTPVPATVFSAASYESTFYPAVKDTLRIGANYVAIPLEYDGLALYVNDDLFAQTGLPVPTTWDELRKAAITMTRCQSETGNCSAGDPILVSGVALGTTNNVDHWQDVIGVLMLQNNTTVGAPTGQPATDVISYYSNFTQLYNMWNKDLPSSTKQFAAGKVGFYFGPSWRVFDIKALNPQLKFSLHPIPQLPVDPDRGEKPVTWASFWVEGVNSKSPYAAESWELLKYMSSPEIMQKLNQLQAQSGRDFGEPYSRVDLADKSKDNPYVGPILSQAPLARTWYLASAADDGSNGIVTKISQAYADVIGKKSSLPDLTSQINAILTQYGLSATTR